MPGGLETYMSPVLHTLDDGSMYVLFGHGGETVPGSIMHCFAVKSYLSTILAATSND